MERQLEIRQALNSFLPSLTPPKKSADTSSKTSDTIGQAEDNPGAALQFAASDAQRAVLSDLQHSLHKHGIEAGMEEIGRGLMEALAARPSVCRGLLAAYLLDL